MPYRDGYPPREYYASKIGVQDLHNGYFRVSYHSGPREVCAVVVPVVAMTTGIAIAGALMSGKIASVAEAAEIVSSMFLN